MSDFPLLKTKAVTQYPATKTVQFQNQAFRFVDGAEQRYRDAASALHTWVIQLDALDEDEMAAIDVFFSQYQGQAGSFAFADPWDGTLYPSCSLQKGELTLKAMAETHGRTSLTIAENRS